MNKAGNILDRYYKRNGKKKTKVTTVLSGAKRPPVVEKTKEQIVEPVLDIRTTRQCNKGFASLVQPAIKLPKSKVPRKRVRLAKNEYAEESD